MQKMSLINYNQWHFLWKNLKYVDKAYILDHSYPFSLPEQPRL